MRSRRRLAAAVALRTRASGRALWMCLVLSCGSSLAHAEAIEVDVLPLAFHVADGEQGPVVDAGFLDAQLARANAIFTPYGVRFAEAERATLAAKHARMEDRADRDALGGFVRAGAVHCFVVASLRDVDEPERMRQGVHWHSRTHRGAHFVILSAIAGPDVLAHELGHYLGNPRHSEVPGNLMSYQRGTGPPVLDDEQLRRVRRAIRRYRRLGELPR